MPFRLLKNSDSIITFKNPVGTKKPDRSVHITQNPQITSKESTAVSENKTEKCQDELTGSTSEKTFGILPIFIPFFKISQQSYAFSLYNTLFFSEEGLLPSKNALRYTIFLNMLLFKSLVYLVDY